jgi:hypothetical protein
MKRIVNLTSRQIIIITATVFIAFVLMYIIVVFCMPSLNVENKLYNFALYASSIAIPLLTLINIYVFIFLTREVQKINNVAHEKQIETNRKIAVMNLRYEEYRKYCQLDNDIKEIRGNIKDKDFLSLKKNFYELQYSFNMFTYRNNILFPKIVEILLQINMKESFNEFSKHIITNNVKKTDYDLLFKLHGEVWEKYDLLSAEMKKWVLE